MGKKTKHEIALDRGMVKNVILCDNSGVKREDEEGNQGNQARNAPIQSRLCFSALGGTGTSERSLDNLRLRIICDP
jgi:hypothetical protein